MQSYTPKQADKGRVRYRGINLGDKQLYFTAIIGREYISPSDGRFARVDFDKAKKTIKVTITSNEENAFEIKSGVAYCYYLNCPLVQEGMPKGRYIFTGSDHSAKERGLIFTHKS